MCNKFLTEGLGQSHIDRVDMHTGLTIWQAGYLTMLLFCEINKWCIRTSTAPLGSLEGKGACWGHVLKTELTTRRAGRNRVTISCCWAMGKRKL